MNMNMILSRVILAVIALIFVHAVQGLMTVFQIYSERTIGVFGAITSTGFICFVCVYRISISRGWYSELGT